MMNRLLLTSAALLTCFGLLACQSGQRETIRATDASGMESAHGEGPSPQMIPALERPSVPEDDTDAPLSRVPDTDEDENGDDEPGPARQNNELEEDVEACWIHKKESDAWTIATLKALDEVGVRLLTTQLGDSAEFCPNYDNLSSSDKRAFWVYFLSAIAKRESNLNPKLTYTESFNDSTKTKVRSRGLLQLSYESSKLYGCGFTTRKEIYVAEKNLRCGIKILDHWITIDGAIAGKTKNKTWRGAARYWSVLRKPRAKAWIKKQTSTLDFCKTAKKDVRAKDDSAPKNPSQEAAVGPSWIPQKVNY